MFYVQEHNTIIKMVVRTILEHAQNISDKLLNRIVCACRPTSLDLYVHV